MKYLLAVYGGDKSESLYPSDVRTRTLIDQAIFFNVGIFFIRNKTIVVSDIITVYLVVVYLFLWTGNQHITPSATGGVGGSGRLSLIHRCSFDSGRRMFILDFVKKTKVKFLLLNN